jgi:arylsulfatase A
MQAVRMGDWKAVRPQPEGKLELYNLKTHPFEQHDTASENPKVLARIQAYLTTVRTQPRPQAMPEPDFQKPA